MEQTHTLREAGLGLLPATIRVSRAHKQVEQPGLCVSGGLSSPCTRRPHPHHRLVRPPSRCEANRPLLSEGLPRILPLGMAAVPLLLSFLKVPMGGPQQCLSHGRGWKMAHRRREVLQQEVWIQTVIAMFMVSRTVRSFWEAQLVTWTRLGISEQWF